MEAELARTISAADVVVFVGGGNLMEYNGMFDCRTSLLLGIIVHFAKKPVVASGQGIGPIETRFTKFLLKAFFSRARFVTFRDPFNSKDLLEDLGIHLEEGGPVGDDSTSLPARTVQDRGAFSGRKRIAINFRISQFTPNMQYKFGEFIEFVSIMAKNEKWQVDFFIFDPLRNTEKNVIDEIIIQSGLESFVIHDTGDPAAARFLLGKCDVAIGIAYHFLVFALAEGTPAIGLWSGRYYKDKLEGLFAWYGKQHWTIPYDSIDSDKLAKLCFELAEKKSELAPLLMKKTGEMGLASDLAIEKAFSFSVIEQNRI